MYVGFLEYLMVVGQVDQCASPSPNTVQSCVAILAHLGQHVAVKHRYLTSKLEYSMK